MTLDLPDLGRDTPQRYAAALYIGDVIAARATEAAHADSMLVKFRTDGGARKNLDVTLVEKDGAAWTVSLPAAAAWSTVRVSLSTLRPTRSIHIPSPYPGLWNYWREAPVGRLGAGDHIQIGNVERLQLTVTPNAGEHAGDDARGVAVESILLTFAASP